MSPEGRYFHRKRGHSHLMRALEAMRSQLQSFAAVVQATQA